MKKLFTIVSVLAVSATVSYAQRTVAGEMTGKARPNTLLLDKADTTVLFTPGIANPTPGGCDTLAVYTTNGGGSVTGFNEYGDLEKAAIFGGSGNVIAVVAQVAFAASNPGFEMAPLAAKIYSVNMADSSFTQLGVSPGIPVSSIDDSSGVPTVWPVTAAVNGTFAASVEVGVYGDSTIDAGIFIFSTREDCGNGDLLWEKFNNGTWVPVSLSWPIEIEVAIGVAITGYASNPDVDLISGMTLFPNPVEDQFNLAYTSAVSGNVRIDLIDATGRTIQVVNDGYKTAGTYTTNIQTQNLAAGLYTYRLTMGGKQAQGKFMVK